MILPAASILKLATDTTQTGALFTLAKPAAFSGYLPVTAFTQCSSNILTLTGNPATSTFCRRIVGASSPDSLRCWQNHVGPLQQSRQRSHFH